MKRESKNKYLPQNQCDDKRAYLCKLRALDALSETTKRNEQKGIIKLMHTYRCTICNKWHIGGARNEQQKAYKQLVNTTNG